MTTLTDILARKTKEIDALPVGHAAVLQRRSLVTAVRSKCPSLIAEIKPISPVRGRLIEESDIPAVVDIYSRHAQAISVLCDTATFGGGFPLLVSVRARTDLPLLAKDFIVDRRQIDAAASYGADAVLLIAAILSPEKLQEFSRYAASLGLDVLLELHTGGEVDIALDVLSYLSSEERSHILLGINNRDLGTQTIDLQTTERLAALLRLHLPDGVPLISESGISSSADVRQLLPHVQGFLIGSAILTSENPDAFLQSLFSAS